MSEWDYALRLGEAEGVRIGAIVVSVVVSFTIEAVFACRAIPDGVVRVQLLTKLTPMGEWEGFSGMTSLCIIVMILWHGIPL